MVFGIIYDPQSGSLDRELANLVGMLVGSSHCCLPTKQILPQTVLKKNKRIVVIVYIPNLRNWLLNFDAVNIILTSARQ